SLHRCAGCAAALLLGSGGWREALHGLDHRSPARGPAPPHAAPSRADGCHRVAACARRSLARSGPSACGWGIGGAPESEVPFAVTHVAPVPARGTQHGGATVPRAAPHHMCPPGPGPHWIVAWTRLVGVGRVPVFTPLPHVPSRVEETIRTGARRTDADRVVAGVAALAPEDPAFGSRLLVPPRELAGVGPPRCLLPLRLRREPRARPLAVRPGLVPPHVGHRVVVVDAPERWRRQGAPRGGGEALEELPGDRELVHQKSRDVCRVRQGFPLGLEVAHRELALGNPHHDRAIACSAELREALGILASGREGESRR